VGDCGTAGEVDSGCCAPGDGAGCCGADDDVLTFCFGGGGGTA